MGVGRRLCAGLRGPGVVVVVFLNRRRDAVFPKTLKVREGRFQMR